MTILRIGDATPLNTLYPIRRAPEQMEWCVGMMQLPRKHRVRLPLSTDFGMLDIIVLGLEEVRLNIIPKEERTFVIPSIYFRARVKNAWNSDLGGHLVGKVICGWCTTGQNNIGGFLIDEEPSERGGKE